MYYICGFVTRKIINKIECEECTNLLIDDEHNLSPYTHFTDHVNRGKLVRASSDVFKIINFFFNQFRNFAATNWAKMNAYNICALASRMFAGNVFRGHRSNGDLGEDNHDLMLIKMISMLFSKVYCHKVSKEKTLKSNVSNLGVRQKLNKLILFSHV